MRRATPEPSSVWLSVSERERFGLIHLIQVVMLFRFISDQKKVLVGCSIWAVSITSSLLQVPYGREESERCF